MTDLSIEHPLSSRNQLPAAVRAQLIDYGYGSWDEHPRFLGQAAFLLRIHGFFRDASRLLVAKSEELLGSATPDVIASPNFRESQMLAAQLIEVAHHHHHIEDEFFFPQCAAVWAPLADGLALLESDHVVLAEGLDALGSVVRPQPGADGEALLDLIHSRARHLERVLERHLADEEEIVIPMLLDGRVG